jgi:hypothetical protein
MRTYFVIAAALAGLLGCGPSQVHLDPRTVSAVTLKLATAEPTFCPGEPAKLEIRAQLHDGSTCSSSDTGTNCMGKQGTLIDPNDLRLQGSAGEIRRSKDALFWVPPSDPLTTAEKGLTLRGWVESDAGGAVVRSPLGQVEMRPEYRCLRESAFAPPPPATLSQSGGTGPSIKVAATLIATPFYPEALFVRVDHPRGRTYLISTDRSQPLVVVSKGQPGSAGSPGQNGSNGPDGADGSARACEAGKPGMNGTDGKLGGPGGNGGPGGPVQLFLDEAVADKMQGWLRVGSVGGDAGPGGRGGGGGAGGRGGNPSDAPGCSAAHGTSGHPGSNAPGGPPGQPGPPGPAPTVANGSRQALFGEDLARIEALEVAAKTKR